MLPPQKGAAYLILVCDSWIWMNAVHKGKQKLWELLQSESCPHISMPTLFDVIGLAATCIS